MHMKHMRRVMKYLAETRENGSLMSLKELWDSNLDFEQTIKGWSNNGHGTYPCARKGVCGNAIELNAIPVEIKS